MPALSRVGCTITALIFDPARFIKRLALQYVAVAEFLRKSIFTTFQEKQKTIFVKKRRLFQYHLYKVYPKVA